LHTQAYLETSFPMTLIHFNFTSCRVGILEQEINIVYQINVVIMFLNIKK